jgi:Tfp pilus assembly protein PilF
MKSLLRPLFWACLVMIIFSAPLLAQKGGHGGGTGGSGGGGAPHGGTPAPGPAPSSTGNPSYGYPNMSNPWPYGICEGTTSCPTTTPRPMPATPLKPDPTCFLPPADGIQSPTVSVIRLEVPEKAKHEYDKACSDVHHKKYSKAEKHLQKAIDAYSADTAAWVLLGQVQEAQHKADDAAQSCSRAKTIDSGYAPSYLCLAHLAAAQHDWRQVEQLTTQVLRLHPLNASNAYYFNALAYLKLNNLSSAETSALRGVEDTKKEHQPQLHLLLAQIYEKKGDRDSEAAELHEYLKRAPHGNDAAEVSSVLKGIDKPK